MVIKIHEVATRNDVHTTQLALTKEIEVTRGQIKETELKLVKEIEKVQADLTKEIEIVRAEMKETELKLVKEIEQVRADLTKEIHASHVSTLRWLIGLFVTGVLTQAGVIIGLFQVFGK